VALNDGPDTTSTTETRAQNYSVRCKQGSTNEKRGTCVNTGVTEPKDKYGNILPYAEGGIGIITTACKLLTNTSDQWVPGTYQVTLCSNKAQKSMVYDQT
jgi:hypothetical protein